MKKERNPTTGVSFAQDVWDHIERIRGFVPRSIIINNALRDYYGLGEAEA